jgi:hypothetical protein
MADTPKRRARRQFTDEFKAGAVRLVLDEGKSIGAAARERDADGYGRAIVLFGTSADKTFPDTARKLTGSTSFVCKRPYEWH